MSDDQDRLGEVVGRLGNGSVGGRPDGDKATDLGVSGAGFRCVEVDRHDFGKVADVQLDKHFGENVIEAVFIPLACLMAFDVA